MSDTPARFAELRQTANAVAAGAIETLVLTGNDRALNRINVLEFAQANSLREDQAIAAFLHTARLGLFEMSWNLLCPGCGGVLDANATLKTIKKVEYACALCAAGYQPTLDEMVEVSFTVHPRVRRIAAHDPEKLSLVEYNRQVYWSSGICIPEGRAFDDLMSRIVIKQLDLPPHGKATLDVNLPAQFVIAFDPVSHTAQFLDVRGAPVRERRKFTVSLKKDGPQLKTWQLAPGPVQISFTNETDLRTLPGLYLAGDEMHDMLGKRKPFLTAKRLFTDQTFRDLYRTDALDIDQRLKITSLTFLFTDLKGSTSLYERVGDLAAYDLVKTHFRALQEVVSSESGAVVKTIGDAVMATFPTPDKGLSASLRMREAMRTLGSVNQAEELTLKVGLHEGPCLAVSFNERLDYFGTTVNVAARVQGLAKSRAIFATEQVIRHPGATRLLEEAGIAPVAQDATLRGLSDTYKVYEIP